MAAYYYSGLLNHFLLSLAPLREYLGCFYIMIIILIVGNIY